MKLLFLILLSIPISGIAKTELNLEFDIEVQRFHKDPEGNTWVSEQRTNFFGIGGIQFHADGSQIYRLIITAKKPYDLKGSFKVRMPNRVDGVVALENSTKVSIILGPQEGCKVAEDRCKPITSQDVGNLELMLALKRAKKVSLGIILLRPYESSPSPMVRTSLSHRDKPLPCGSKVESGWWIFASSTGAHSDPLNGISLCVRKPDGEFECAKEKEEKIRVKMGTTGIFQFITWDGDASYAICEVEAVS